MTFEHLNTIFHHVRGKHKQPFTFLYCVDSFYPWKDIVEKKVSKLRSIAELRAFYGTLKNRTNKDCKTATAKTGPLRTFVKSATSKAKKIIFGN
jgi:hypothetical protein